MIFTYKELLDIEKSRNNINKKLLNKQLYRVDKGIYSFNEIVDPLVIYAKKYDNAIVTLDNAFYYYGLTDVIPDKYCLATKHKAKKIKNDKIVQVFTTDKLFEIGKIQVLVDGNLISMYDKERLLIELIRKRKQMSFDYYKEIIRNYRMIVSDLNMKKLEKYASYFNVGEHILDVIGMEVL